MVLIKKVLGIRDLRVLFKRNVIKLNEESQRSCQRMMLAHPQHHPRYTLCTDCVEVNIILLKVSLLILIDYIIDCQYCMVWVLLKLSNFSSHLVLYEEWIMCF